jgi:hypothetical protein
MEDKIKLISLFFSKQRIIGCPQLDELFELDDLWKKIYNENRIKHNFGEAALMANEKVIKKILL